MKKIGFKDVIIVVLIIILISRFEFQAVVEKLYEPFLEQRISETVHEEILPSNTASANKNTERTNSGVEQLSKRNAKSSSEKIGPIHELPNDITSYVSVNTEGDSNFSMVSYSLESPLLPSARLLSFTEIEGVFWFAGNTGLISFEPAIGRWSYLSRNDGLPADTAYKVAQLDGKLVFTGYDWSQKGHLHNRGYYSYSNSTFLKSHFSTLEAKIGGVELPQATSLQGRARNLVFDDNHIWLPFTGHHVSREQGFADGGILQADRVGRVIQEFTIDDGLYAEYSIDAVITKDGTVWVVHGRDHKAISYLAVGEDKWKSLKNSANGSSLWGSKIYAKDHFIFLAQDNKLVIFDVKSKMTKSIQRENSLPGISIADIQYGLNDSIWVTAYSFSREGQKEAGLLQINYEDIRGWFEENYRKS